MKEAKLIYYVEFTLLSICEHSIFLNSLFAGFLFFKSQIFSQTTEIIQNYFQNNFEAVVGAE